MRCFLALIAFLSCLSAPAHAQSADGCSKSQRQMAAHAVGDANQMTIMAAVSIADHELFAKWFGSYSTPNAETVRATLKSAVTAMRSGRVSVQCVPAQGDGCQDGTIAWVSRPQAFVLNLCPGFFDLPMLDTATPDGGPRGDSTQEGTVLHEMTHFQQVGRTEDYCYTRRVCAEMATARPGNAIRNADSYQYFAEDIIYLSRQSQPPGKTAKSGP
ncbi:M35 family metallo-endopeptidase [Yoonia sediminilitoris]|uniref:Lysine-specific metallo-endopeptidase family protein n=1 Tax=Yoonia sediminilitoris TaxID=1286148 RepID=A0A2T6K963_9RHOB|nr:M35 family metallo-endopeptidase [Yoonia sediminilitoris]PUB11318.1 lysine-specific metallo-endopeptidase family protein [Yoonia sediminilitoris]RCW91134.1 lysine-specific metallo-endopeptidase family protein [Yoonia sediminilitoris]